MDGRTDGGMEGRRIDGQMNELSLLFITFLVRRKAGLNEVIPQFILFFTYIVSLGTFIMYQPCAISERNPKSPLVSTILPYIHGSGIIFALVS